MFQLASRGGLYLVFIIGVIMTWVATRYFKVKPMPVVLPDSEDKTEADFIAALSDKDWHLRLWAAQNLSTSATETAIPALVKALQDSDPDVREAAAQGLIRLRASQTVAPLVQSLSLETRETAVKVLTSISDTISLDALTGAALNDSSAWVRIPAIEALSQQNDSRYLPIFSQILQDSQKEIYEAAKNALIRLDSPEALRAIAENPYQDKSKKPKDKLDEIS
jgi:HEAT repeat protein